MAVGKVGSFATVEPAIVDFGGMAKSAIDSVKEDRERKRREQEAARAKRQQEIEKVGSLGFLKSTNTKAFNQGLDSIYRDMKDEFAMASMAGDVSKMKELKDSVFSINNTIDNVVRQQEFYLKNEDKFDPKFIDRNKQILENIDIGNMDVSRGEGGRVEFTIYKDNKKEQPLFQNMTINEIQDSLEVPYAFNEDAVIKDFKKNFELDKIESLLPNQLSTTKVSELKSDERVKEAIDRKANLLSNDNKAMAWYGANFLDKFQSNARGFTEEEKKQAADYFAKTLQQSYNTEIDLKVREKTGRGGSKDDTPNFGVPELLPNVAGLSNVIYSDIIASGGKKGGISYSASEDIVGIAFDPVNKEMYPITAASVGLSTSIGTGDGGTRQGAGTSGRASELRSIETESDRKAVLKRIATLKGYNTIQELRQGLFETQQDPLGIL